MAFAAGRHLRDPAERLLRPFRRPAALLAKGFFPPARINKRIRGRRVQRAPCRGRRDRRVFFRSHTLPHRRADRFFIGRSVYLQYTGKM
jgi:hypothetical protein